MQDRTFSRRQALRAGAFTFAGGATLLAGTTAAHAQSKETRHLDARPHRRRALVRAPRSSRIPRTNGRQGWRLSCLQRVQAPREEQALQQRQTPPTRAAAHKGCLCTVVDGPVLAGEVFDSVFVDSDSCDRRDPRVAAILTGGTVDPVPVPMIAGIAVPVVLVAAGGIGYAIWRRNQRRLDSGDRDGVGRVHRTAADRRMSLT